MNVSKRITDTFPNGLGDVIEFAGRVPYPALPARLRGFDVCLSTQTDDLIGRVRLNGAF